jgi:hypothetical protein
MPLDESVRTQIETYLTHLNALIRRGREVGIELAANPSDPVAIAATRTWQEDCGVTINQLSGGSKSHWLAQSFSAAFLMRAADGRAAQGAPPTEIVNRLINVLEQAIATLSAMEDIPGASEFSSASALAQAPAPRRFEFVHNADIRPVLEQAYADSKRALEQADYDLALKTSCGILEAIVIQRRGRFSRKRCACGKNGGLVVSNAPRRRREGWTHSRRLHPIAGNRALLSRPCRCGRCEPLKSQRFRTRRARNRPGPQRYHARSVSDSLEPHRIFDLKPRSSKGQSSKSCLKAGCDGFTLPSMTATSRFPNAFLASSNDPYPRSRCSAPLSE